MRKTIVSTLIAFLILGVLPGSVFGIGMMTEPIVIKDILRGQETSVLLTLLNSENKEVTYGLKAEGQIANWVKFYKTDDKNFQNAITEIKMPAENFTNVKVRFSVPKDMPNGKYTGEVLAFLSSSGEVKTDQTSVNVSQQVGRKVTITVTDKEIINLEASVIPLQYGVKSGNPLKVKIEYYNKGNISLRPDVQLKILKDGNVIFGAVFLYPESEEAIKPEERKTFSSVEWQTSGQSDGDYSAEVKIMNGDSLLAENSFKFSVGNFPDYLLASSISSFLGGNKTVLVWFTIGGLFITAALVLNNFKKNGRETFNNYLKK